MADHRASVTVNASAHQVFELFSHFNDYPKFMTYVREVTYVDDECSHWVVDVLGVHEWDAVNDGWIPDRRIGWRSVSGLENSGSVTFEALEPERTRVSVDITYTPPAGVIGQIGEAFGAGGAFVSRLQHDLDHFAKMVEQSPRGALDPTSSSYLFHDESAASQGKTTLAQDQTMGISTDVTDDLATSRDAASGRIVGDLRSDEDTQTSDTPRSAHGGAIMDDALVDPTLPVVPGTTPGQREIL